MIPRPVCHVLLVVSASLLCVVTALSGAASAKTASVTKGSPQPELKPFTLAAKDFSGGGSVALLPSGSLLAAYDVPTADHRGGDEGLHPAAFGPCLCENVANHRASQWREQHNERHPAGGCGVGEAGRAVGLRLDERR